MRLFTLLFSTTLACCLFFQTKAQDYSIHQLDSLQALQDRPVMIFITADWCKFCSAMREGTFTDKEVQSQLNQHFYFISFNGEEKENIKLKGQTFKYIPLGKGNGVHELATELGTIKDRLSFPTITVLNTDGEISFQHSGYLKKDAFLAILNEAK